MGVGEMVPIRGTICTSVLIPRVKIHLGTSHLATHCLRKYSYLTVCTLITEVVTSTRAHTHPHNAVHSPSYIYRHIEST